MGADRQRDAIVPGAYGAGVWRGGECTFAGAVAPE